MRRGIPFVVSAPSGTGKTTVCRAIVERDPDLVFSVSHTTRSRRPAERDGVDYHFVTPEAFERLAAEGGFLEHAEYRGNHYGTSWAAIEGPLGLGCDVVLEIDVQGAEQVRERLAEARLIFLLPPSREELESRLRGRGTDAPDVIARRLAVAAEEIPAARWYHYVVFNQELERAIEEVLAIVRAERAGDTEAARARWGREAVLRRVDLEALAGAELPAARRLR